MDEHEPEILEETASEEEVRRRRQVAACVLLGLFVLLAALLLLDLWVVRSPWQRSFLSRNLECLRCHTELVPRLDEAAVHQPFVTSHCTSCHGRHGYRRTPRFRPGDFEGFGWLRLNLEQLGMQAVWRIVSGSALIPDDPTAPHVAGSRRVTGDKAGLVTTERELCWQCHGNLGPEFDRAVLHRPFEQGDCTSCHDPHASPSRRLLRNGTTDLCVACHRVGPELIAADVHKPFGDLRCLDCHEPHASDHPGMLVRQQRELCLGCHGDIAGLLARSVRHDPFGRGDCTRCHRPHSGSYSSLLNAPQPLLCYECHGGVRGAFSLASRHPVPSRLLCSDCHEAHAAPQPALLPVEQRALCLGCHGGVRAELTRRNVHRVVHEGDCTRCHKPHGSTAAPLLQLPDPKLCLGCHPEKQPDAPRRKSSSRAGTASRSGLPPAADVPRPTGPDPSTTELPSVPPRRGSHSHPLPRGTLCTSCHEAHASDNATLLRASGDALCLRCHSADVSRFSASRHAPLPCGRCHTIHGAPYRPLLVARNPEVCLGCHGEFGPSSHSHPASPVLWDSHAWEPLTCTSTCHDPHGSSFDSMLRVPYLTSGYGSDYICLLCHTEVGVNY